MDTAPILEMKDITKIYGNGIVANYKVNFNLIKGEIHALAGENGAGKSTLMKILFGMEKYDDGTILLNSKPLDVNSPNDAIKSGIGMVHQHFMLVPSLTVAENIVLGYEETKMGVFLDNKSIYKKCEDVSKKYNLIVNPKDKVADLSVSTKQKIEILKALLRNARILILDEPTAVLTPQETSQLFKQLIHLKEDGYTIIFISHKLNEIKEICDRITIMRSGLSKGTYNIKDISVEDISRLMVGRDIEKHIHKAVVEKGNTILDVENVTYLDNTGKAMVNNVSLKVKEKQILGIAGVEGNGQRELIDMITGLKEIQCGDIKINGSSIKNNSIKQIRTKGLAHIPEDRMVYGAALEANIKENIISDRVDTPKFSKFSVLKGKVITEESEKHRVDYKIKADSVDREVGMLSGGNIQKVVVAREMSSGFDILVADQPSRGIDVGAARFIHERIVEMRDNGKAILLVSADLNEIMELSDSLIVMYSGEITAYFENVKNITEEELGYYMLGIKKQDPEDIRRALL